MGGKIITCVAFEVVPENETQEFGIMEVDLTSTFVGQWATSNPVNATLLDDEEEESIEVVSPTPFELTEQQKRAAQNPVHANLFDTNEDSIEVVTTTPIESVEHSDRAQPMSASNVMEQLKKPLQSKRTSSKKKSEQRGNLRHNSRIVRGLSTPKNLPRTGPLPVCQGCKQKSKGGTTGPEQPQS